jgi:hypothetical protein
MRVSHLFGLAHGLPSSVCNLKNPIEQDVPAMYACSMNGKFMKNRLVRRQKSPRHLTAGDALVRKESAL